MAGLRGPPGPRELSFSNGLNHLGRVYVSVGAWAPGDVHSPKPCASSNQAAPHVLGDFPGSPDLLTSPIVTILAEGHLGAFWFWGCFAWHSGVADYDRKMAWQAKRVSPCHFARLRRIYALWQLSCRIIRQAAGSCATASGPEPATSTLESPASAALNRPSRSRKWSLSWPQKSFRNGAESPRRPLR